ncbi:MAG: hypothetical protein ACTMIA_07230, partial [Vibrio sp.]
QYEPAKVIRDSVGATIGVESVVGLQSLAKPLYKKIINKQVSEHAVIRVLNRLYKRPIPLLDEEKSDVSFEQLSSDITEQDAEQSDESLGEAHQEALPNSTPVDNMADSADTKSSLDFTQKHF